MFRKTIGLRGRIVPLSALALAILLSRSSASGQQTIYWADAADSVVYSARIPTAPNTNSFAAAPVVYASGFYSPVGIALDTGGNLYVADQGDGGPSAGLYMIAPGGGAVGSAAVTTIVSGIPYAYGVALDSSGDVYMTPNFANEEILKYTPNGSGGFTQSTFYTALNNTTSPPPGTYFHPFALAFDSQGNLYDGDAGDNKDDTSANIYEITPDGSTITNFASGLSKAFGLAFDKKGDLWEANNGTGQVNEFSSSGMLLNTISGLTAPVGLAFDANGDLWVAEDGGGTKDNGLGSIAEYSTAAASFGTLLNQITGLDGVTGLAFGPVGAAPASGIEWAGTTSGAWSDATNWTGGMAPGIAGATNATAISTDGALFDLTVTNTTVTVDSGRNVMNLIFNTAAVSSMTIGATHGPALLLTSGGMIQINSTVVNPQIVNAPLVLEGSYTFSNNSSTSTATLTVGGGITAATASSVTTLTLSGANSGANTLAGIIADGSGGAQLAIAAQGGNWTLSGANTYSGGTTVSAGLLAIANTTGSGTGSGPVGVSSGSLVVTGSVSGTVTVTGGSATINGSVGGSLNVTTGSSLVAGSVAGTVTITSGSVTVNGSVAGPVIVNGGTLAGTGNINGALSVNLGGTLAPGAANNLTVNNTAGLATGSILSYTLSTPGVANAGTMGGNTLTTVNGALTLNPGETVNVAGVANFATGTYVLAHYTSLVNNSNNFSGWTVNGPSTNIYTLQIDPTNKDVELVARPLAAPAVVQNLYVAVNGAANGNGDYPTADGFTGVQGNSIMEYANPAVGAGAPVQYGATIQEPEGLGFDGNGNLFVGDNNSPTSLYEITAGAASTTQLSTGGPYSYGLTVDHNNNVYVTRDHGPVQVASAPYTSYTTFTPSSTIAEPFGMATDPSGNIWICNTDQYGSVNGVGVADVQEFAPTNGTTALKTVGLNLLNYPVGMGFDSAGDIFVADYLAGKIYEFTAASGYANPSSAFATIADPIGVAVNSAGDVFVASSQAAGFVNEYSPTGVLLGTIGDGTALSYPFFIALTNGASASPAWTGGAGDNMWMVGDTMNWSTGVVPGNNTGSATSGYYNTDTALFNQDDAASDPRMIQANLNVMNITFDNSGGLLTTTITIGMTTGNPLLLTDGGTIQMTSSVTTPQIINAPLVLEGTLGALTNSYSVFNNSTTSTATFTFGGTITSGASLGVTTLNLGGTNTGTNTIAGPITDGPNGAKIALAVQGGSWALTAANSYSGGTTIASGATLELANPSASAMTSSMNIVNSGSLLVAAPKQVVGTILGSGSVTVSSGSLTAYQIRQNSLTIGSGATVTLSPSGSGSTTNPTGPNNVNFSSTLASLSIAGTTGAWTGTLDIGNNGLVIAYGTATDPYVTIDNMIETGFDAAHWDGQGITSSLGRAAANSHTPLNIGLEDFTPGKGNFSNTTFIAFEGQTVTTNAILIRLTYMDDIVLSGDMSTQDAASDALLFAANYGSGTTWSVGDLEHTGLVGSADALLFAANYTPPLASLDGSTGGDAALGSGMAAVPEPASLGLLAVGAVGLLAVRRRFGHQANGENR